MNFLLDTNVVSEWVSPRPAPGVVQWLAAVDEDRVFLSVISVAEIRHGIEALPSTAGKRERLQVWLSQELVPRFAGRLLSIDVETAMIWGRLTAQAQSAGRKVAAMDGFIAATAARHDLTLVTRNVADFEDLGTRLLNPWLQ